MDYYVLCTHSQVSQKITLYYAIYTGRTQNIQTLSIISHMVMPYANIFWFLHQVDELGFVLAQVAASRYHFYHKYGTCYIKIVLHTYKTPAG